MKKPTIDEMKLLVAGMIPEHINTYNQAVYGQGGRLTGTTPILKWVEPSVAITEYEWLYVCHLAEQSLGFHDAPEWPEHEAPGTAYSYILNQVCRRKNEGPLFASAESRLEALCRIKHPNLFQ